jgi:6-phosphofructo-2-kinase/fructose-2,6-biphosphatase 4
MDIPNLKFPRDEIIEIIPAAYQNEAKRIRIPGLDPKLLPGSPDGISLPASRPMSRPGSGQMSPVPGGLGSPIPGGLGSPAEPLERPSSEKVINTSKDMVADKIHDEI